MWVCKMGLQKNCKISATELKFLKNVMRGFQKGITLGGKTLGNLQNVGVQNRVAKNLQNFYI